MDGFGSPGSHDLPSASPEGQPVPGLGGLASAAAPAPVHSPAERSQLLEIARRSVRAAVTGQAQNAFDPGAWASRLAEERACFVTLKSQGKLRGCIGHLWPRAALGQAVGEAARKAAREDPRFAPIEPGELDAVAIEISVLSTPVPLGFSSPDQLLAQLEPHRDGVVLDIGPYRATYLPQVWEQLPDPAQFLSSLALKAGCRARDWRGPEVRVLVYRVELVTDRPGHDAGRAGD